MATLSIAILGLGRMGTSVGLALKRYMEEGGKYTFEIVGYDPRASAEKQAKKLKAIDSTVAKAFDAVRDKQIVVIALPYDEVQGVYEYIAPDLRDGVVILDASPVKAPSLEWAKKHLTEEHHVVGMTPIINGAYLFDNVDETSRATADYFENGSIVLTPGAGCVKEAVDLAYNFAIILGGQPAFSDPYEHDSLLAFTEGLPSLLGVSLFFNALKNQGWDDIRRFTNADFGAITHKLFDTHPDDLRDEWMANREHLVRNLDELIATLLSVRELLANKDRDAIEALLVNSAEDYEAWYNARLKSDWTGESQTKVTAHSTMIGSLLGGGLVDKLMGRKEKDDED